MCQAATPAYNGFMLKRMLAGSATMALIVGGASPARAGKKPSPSPRPAMTMDAVRVPLKPPVRAMAELEAALASPDAATRAAAAWELTGAGSVPEAVGNRLKEAFLEDPDAGVRTAAAWAYAHVRQGVGEGDGSLQRLPFDEPPRLVQQPKPKYPERAFYDGIQGTVTIEFVVDEEGRIAHAEIRRSVPPLDAAALAAAREWRFTPARLAGKAVVTVASAPMAFTIRLE